MAFESRGSAVRKRYFSTRNAIPNAETMEWKGFIATLSRYYPSAGRKPSGTNEWKKGAELTDESITASVPLIQWGLHATTPIQSWALVLNAVVNVPIVRDGFGSRTIN